MNEALLDELAADGFGHWLAGFIDGEGCFGIPPNNANGYMCRFSVGLRIDDRPVLETIRARLGIGGIYVRPVTPQIAAMRAGSNASISWVVTDQRGCAAVVRIFDRFPLRAKKARDFAIWREAVATLQSMPPRNSHRARDWSHMAMLKEALRSGRDVDLPASSRAVPVETRRTPAQEELPVG